LSSADLFDRPTKEGPTSLLVAARRAKAKADQAHQQLLLAPHLQGINQPKNLNEADEESLSSADLFDRPTKEGPTSLLAAARRAKARVDQSLVAKVKVNQAEMTPRKGLEANSTALNSTTEEEKSSSIVSKVKIDIRISHLSNESQDKSVKEFSSSYTLIDDESKESSLSSGELDELDQLFWASKRGEKCNVRRLHDLEIFDKWQCGEHLTAKEKADLQIFRQMRKKERLYRAEFQSLIEQKETGSMVDEGMYYVGFGML